MPHRLIAPLLFDDLLDDRGNACRHHVVRKVFRHDAARGNYATAADGNPLQHGYVRAKPAVIAYNNRQSLLETGGYNPTLNLCVAICKALRVTLNDLFWEDETDADPNAL